MAVPLHVRLIGIADVRLRQLVQFVMPGLAPGIHVFKTARHEGLDGRT
jgi:hypothetical protein